MSKKIKVLILAILANTACCMLVHAQLTARFVLDIFAVYYGVGHSTSAFCSFELESIDDNGHLYQEADMQQFLRANMRIPFLGYTMTLAPTIWNPMRWMGFVTLPGDTVHDTGQVFVVPFVPIEPQPLITPTRLSNRELFVWDFCNA